ncbi:hypothetical protein P691DRAFT_809556 [Macrolepiota fuliginosa MF-IS2]|uniref:F-box domain-containing protein n=1 Tax=Macrolepiota fuliginosa MF-IS2 TaxID=1400762 RepID=A0A9P5X2D5_9AGAR|nr:hypothetical protein P691DRAFT_809556 [Macrolepiota fuliginosa MF-IS2]
MALSSSLYRKLHNNDSPTNEEVVEIQKALTASWNRLHALESDVSQLRSRFNNLSVQKEILHAFVEGHTKFLSPARRLLPEILQEIFYHCLPTAHNTVMCSQEPPLLLGRVCSQWRQVAYSTPRLWTRIHIIATRPTPVHYQLDAARREAVTAWLSRSGVLPLSISMSTNRAGFSRRAGTLVNDQMQPYLDLIAPYTQRWKSIYLNLPNLDWAGFFNEFNASDLPLLESLHIEGDRRRRDQASLDITSLSRKDGILQAPRLHNLSLASYIPRLLELCLRWDDLTYLDLGSRSLSLEDVAKALARCPNLEACSISIMTPSHQSPTGLPTHDFRQVALPKLRTLVVISRPAWTETAWTDNTGWMDNTTVLFDNLSTPALRHLSYERTAHVWPDSPTTVGFEDRLLTSLRSFFRKLVHPLEELDLWTNPFSGKCAVDILPLLPDLKRLSLRGYVFPQLGPLDIPSPLSLSLPMDDEFLAHFTPQQDDIIPLSLSGSGDDVGTSLAFVCLCPKLDTFRCTDALFSDHAILEFLRSRSIDHSKHNVSHIRRVSISFSPCRTLNTSDGGIQGMKDQIDVLQKESGIVMDIRAIPILSPPSTPPHSLPTRYSPFDGISPTDARPGMLSYFGF